MEVIFSAGLTILDLLISLRFEGETIIAMFVITLVSKKIQFTSALNFTNNCKLKISKFLSFEKYLTVNYNHPSKNLKEGNKNDNDDTLSHVMFYGQRFIHSK